MKLKNIACMLLIGMIFLHSRIAKIYSKAVTVTINKSWDATADNDAIEEMLRTEEIKSIQPLKEYAQTKNKQFDADNTVLLVTLKNDRKAVFKPGEESIGEVIAYQASHLFKKYNFVPPTVRRKIGDEYGSLQLFCDSDIDLLKEGATPFSSEYWNRLPDDYPKAVKLFYFIFGQWDINQGNQIITENNGIFSVSLIDNSGIANLQQVEYGDYAYIRCGYNDNRNDSWDEPFPFDDPQQIPKNITLEEMQELFGGFMTKERINKFWHRYHGKSLNYCVWRNALWVQYYKFDNQLSPLFVKEYTQELVDCINAITEEKLEEIWQEARGILPKPLIKQLIETTLIRCKQILAHAYQIDPSLKK